MTNLFKRPVNDPRNYYTLFIETGLILAMGGLLVLFKMPFNLQNNRSFTQPEQETVKIEDIIQTKQQETPPPPPVPQTPIAVPNDQIIEDVPMNMNSELNINAMLPLPKAPPIAEVQEKSNKNEIFVVVEHMPVLIGGLEGLESKIHYPALALKANIEGKVIVTFYVDEQGNVRDAHVIRGIGGGCDQEALRVVKEAKFKPGMQRGRKVKVSYTLPIIFTLQN